MIGITREVLMRRRPAVSLLAALGLARSVVEPGDFDILVGPWSRERDLLEVTRRAQ